jgi:hypothetical protein
MLHSSKSHASTRLFVAVLYSTNQLLEEESRGILREAASALDKINQRPCSSRSSSRISVLLLHTSTFMADSATNGSQHDRVLASGNLQWIYRDP